MIWQLDLLILTLIILCAFAAIKLKDMLSAVIIFGAYSFLLCLIWVEMGAVDVGFTEAAVGAGVSTVLFIAAVYRTTRTIAPPGPGRNFLKIIGFLSSVALGVVLLFAVGDFPDWANPNSPASLHVSPYYILNTIKDTSVPNIVTSVLADYRGFDTMFETTVIFAAGIAVIAILRRKIHKTDNNNSQAVETGQTETGTNIIIQTICRQMVPFMQLFALYVIAHGHHSPGGGFQGGVILGASFILLALSYDLQKMLKRMSEKWNIILANIGVLIYVGIGTLCVFLGANFLDYSILHKILPATSPIEARSHGMLGIEIGVGIAVMAIMITIYTNIASEGKHDKGL